MVSCSEPVPDQRTSEVLPSVDVQEIGDYLIYDSKVYILDKDFSASVTADISAKSQSGDGALGANATDGTESAVGEGYLGTIRQSGIDGADECDFYASALPVGSQLYSVGTDDGVILVRKGNVELFYRARE